MKTQGSVPRNLESVVDFRSENFTLGQAKLKSVWADERINSIVSEMDSVGLVRENVTAARSEKSLTAEESHQLNQLAARALSPGINDPGTAITCIDWFSLALADIVDRDLPGAVFVDGKYTGRETPIPPDKRLKLTVGKHKVTFEIPGGKRFDFERRG